MRHKKNTKWLLYFLGHFSSSYSDIRQESWVLQVWKAPPLCPPPWPAQSKPGVVFIGWSSWKERIKLILPLQIIGEIDAAGSFQVHVRLSSWALNTLFISSSKAFIKPSFLFNWANNFTPVCWVESHQLNKSQRKEWGHHGTELAQEASCSGICKLGVPENHSPFLSLS